MKSTRRTEKDGGCTILPQFLSNLTRPITHKVIFWGSEIRPRNGNIAYPRFEVYKTFLCVFMSNFMVFMR